MTLTAEACCGINWLPFEKGSTNGVVLFAEILLFSEACIDDETIQLAKFSLTAPVLRQGTPFFRRGPGQTLEGFAEKRGDGLFEQIVATAQLQVCYQDCGTLPPRSMSLSRPAESAFRGVLPEVDAVAEPIPIVLTRLPVLHLLLSEKEFFREPFGAAVVADDNSRELFHSRIREVVDRLMDLS
jgi:hypothetical protein